MAIRLSGINSGLDTDAIVQELVSAYSLKTEKYQKEQTKIEWKQEAWKSLNTKIYGLYTKVSNFRFDSAYNLRKTTVSDSTKATVTAASDAVTGTQKLQILSTAQASYITGKKLDDDVTKSSTLKDLGYTGGESTIEVRGGDGEIHEITVSQTTKISDVVTQLQEVGLNASFDENNKRFFVSAKESGATNDFNLCSTDLDSQNALSLLGLDSSIVEIKDGEKVFTAAGAVYQEGLDLYEAAASAENGKYVTNGTVDVETYLRELIAQYKTDIQNKELEKEGFEDSLQTLTEEYNELVAQRDARTAYDNVWAVLEEVGLTGTEEDTGMSEDEAYAMIRDLYEEDADVTADDVKEYLGEETDDETANKIAEALNENAKIVADYGEDVLSSSLEEVEGNITENKAARAEKETFIKTKESEIADIKAQSYGDLIGLEDDKLTEKINALAEKAALANQVYNTTEPDAEGVERAVKIDGQDAKIILNGAEFTSATNSFSINGLTIEAHAETVGEISITTAVDTQGIYDKIKDFLTEYNNVINEITKLYNADSASDYEPLTDEEKDAMSEEQVEKWEEKIKSALLRRDSSLSSIMSAMINSMSQSIEVNGEKLSLSSFGIQTLGYLNAAENEQYAYHIDGDADDENSSGKTDKLMKAIQENPDQICEFMKQLTSNLYSAIDNKMKSTELSSAYKVYNDKELDSQLTKYKKLISDWEDKVAEQEEYYYDKFSQMEVALSKLQSQTSALSGLLGT